MARVFLSCVSSEFRSYRELLTKQLAAADLGVECQEHYADTARPILEVLDEKVRASDVVVHLVGSGTGFKPKPGKDGRPAEVDEFLARPGRADLIDTSGLAPHRERLAEISYTQWEYWLARYHRKTYLVYRVEASAPREKGFERRPEEEKEQAAHFDRIRDTFDSRATVTGDWHLATRVMVSLIHNGTLKVADATGHPAIVLGFRQGTADDYLSCAAIRWKGRTVPLAPPAPLKLGKDARSAAAACDRLTELIRRGDLAFRQEHLGVQKVVVELVLPFELLTRPMSAWQFWHATRQERVPVRHYYPVRVRVDWPEDASPVNNIRARLALLGRHQEQVVEVCRQLKKEYLTASAARPVVVVHDPAEKGCWHPTAVVCGGFHAPPPKLPPSPAAKLPKRLVRSDLFEAIECGVPFAVWPDAAATPDAVEATLRGHLRPAEWCEYLERQEYVVLAESHDPAFPAEQPLMSNVFSPGAGS